VVDRLFEAVLHLIERIVAPLGLGSMVRHLGWTRDFQTMIAGNRRSLAAITNRSCLVRWLSGRSYGGKATLRHVATAFARGAGMTRSQQGTFPTGPA
jgi:hypothetical protein